MDKKNSYPGERGCGDPAQVQKNELSNDRELSTYTYVENGNKKKARNEDKENRTD